MPMYQLFVPISRIYHDVKIIQLGLGLGVWYLIYNYQKSKEDLLNYEKEEAFKNASVLYLFYTHVLFLK